MIRWGLLVPNTPKPFELHESGALLHGTKADLAVGDLLVPGRRANYGKGRISNHVYRDTDIGCRRVGSRTGRGRRPGPHLHRRTGRRLEDDPNVTDKKFPGNPTHSFRTRQPVRIVGELTDWAGHSPEQLQAMRDRLADLERRGNAVIYD